MATGYRIRTHTDSGNAKIGSTAGSLITVLDDLLTSGSSPWTKTTNGTNDVTYTAPAGSQVKLRVYNNVAHTTSFIVRFTCQVGSNPVFPTPTQETTSGQGYTCMKSRNATSATTTNDQGYIGIRTDRFMMLMITGSDLNPSAGGCMMCAGDVPVFDGSDPGLCIGSGFTQNSLTSTSTTQNTSIPGSLTPYDGSAGLVGYADKHSNGTTNAVPLFFIQTLPASGFSSLSSHLNSLMLGRILLATCSLTTAANLSAAASTLVVRGYVPFLFTFPIATGFATGDTFTDSNGASYTIVAAIAGTFVAVMTSDSEAGLP